MKTLYLIRHADSNTKSTGETDFERVISNKGAEDSKNISKKLVELHFNPELIVCSTAKRAMETAELICTNIAYSFDDIKLISSIYESTTKNLISIINLFPNQHNEIALIGHNPSLTDLVNYLTNDLLGNIPTCSSIKIELDIEKWNELTQGVGKQMFFVYPSLL